MENRIFKNARQMKWMVSQMLRIRTAFAGLLFIFSLGFMECVALSDDASMVTKVRINSSADKAPRITRESLILLESDDDVSYKRYTDDSFTCIIEANKILIENLKLTKPFLKIAFTREWPQEGCSMVINKDTGVMVFKDGKWKAAECGFQEVGTSESGGADFEAPIFGWDYGTRALVVKTRPVECMVRINSCWTDKAPRITRESLILLESDDNVSYKRYADDSFTCVIVADKIVIGNLKVTKPFLKIAFTHEWSQEGCSMVINKDTGVMVFKNGNWKAAECGLQEVGTPESGGADFKAPIFGWDYGTRALVVKTR